MRILWISGLCPLPLTDGHRQRVYHLLRSVALRHPTTLLCQVRPADAPHVAALAPLCERVIAVPRPEGEGSPPLQRLARRVQSLLTQRPTCFLPPALPAMHRELEPFTEDPFDLAIGSLYCAPLVLAAPAHRRVLDDQNVEGDLYRQLWQSERPGPRKLSRFLDWLAVDRFEHHMLPHADLITVCSDLDRHTLQARIPTHPPIAVIPNGIDLSLMPAPPPAAPHPEQEAGRGRSPCQTTSRAEAQPPPSAFRLPPSRPEADVLIFTGGMSYAPNVEAAEHLARDLMPLIWKARPQVRLLLVGKDPHPRVRALASDRVTVTGTVPDPRPYLEQATLAVVPLRSGSGTRLKVLEAMAAGVPIVSTPLGAEGLDLTPGQHLALAESPAEFAAAVLDLLASPEKARRLARAARARVEALYGWDAIGATFLTALEQCAMPPVTTPQEALRAPG